MDSPFQKFIIIILAVIVFTVGLMIGMNIVGYFLGPSSSPYLVAGLIPANVPLIIHQNPNIDGAIPIQRSNNEDSGIEFSWSIWINISDLGKSNQYQHIFHKGDNNIINGDGDNSGLNFPNNAPGLYISPNTNELVVIMNTHTTINEEVRIPNIPLNKWMHIIIRVESNKLDVYINGSLAKRHILGNIVKQNYGNVNVALNGGFQGFISDLRYFNYSLTPGEIISIVETGPDLTINSQSNIAGSYPPYLSLQWYVQEQK